MVTIEHPLLVLLACLGWWFSVALVYADANRMDNMNAAFWAAIAFFTWPLGLVAYGVARTIKLGMDDA